MIRNSRYVRPDSCMSMRRLSSETFDLVQGPFETAPPFDGTYVSNAGVQVRVSRRPAPDSTAGSVEITMRYDRGGAAKEFYCLEHHASASARAAEVFSLFLNDISPYGKSYARTTAQEQAFARIRSVNEARSKAPPAPTPTRLTGAKSPKQITQSDLRHSPLRMTEDREHAAT